MVVNGWNSANATLILNKLPVITTWKGKLLTPWCGVFTLIHFLN